MEHNIKRKQLIESLIELIEEDYEKFHNDYWYEITISEKAFYILSYIRYIISEILNKNKVAYDTDLRSRSDIKRLTYEVIVKNYKISE